MYTRSEIVPVKRSFTPYIFNRIQSREERELGEFSAFSRVPFAVSSHNRTQLRHWEARVRTTDLPNIQKAPHECIRS